MNLLKIFRTVVAISFATLGLVSQSQAAVTTFFSAGTSCGGAASANFATSGPTVQVSLCATTTAPTAMCGHTILLQSATGESGNFTVTARALGANYPDPNSEVSLTPSAINNPATVADFGGTVATLTPIAAAPNQLLATFDLVPQSTATNASYVISLAVASAAAVDADGSCGATTVPTDAPVTASFTLNRTLTPTFTSAASTTFALNVANTFNVTASGSTPITFSATGLPATVGLSSGGVLSGAPTATGTFPVTITATNGSGTAMQNFVLTVSGQATQSISFTGPASQSFGPTLVPLTATASSGLPVTFSSTTLSVCTVSGSNVTMVTTGTCTINANQAGNATFLSAQTVTQSFGITGGVPGAPTIGTAIAGNAQATIAFTAPSSNGGSAITGFTATCGGFSASGAVSPITVRGLTNNTLYTCSVIATNALGTSPASGTVSVTPSASVPLTLIGVQSRKVHGNSAGTFDVPITFTTAASGAVDTESRLIGSGHTIVFQFNQPITAAGAVSLVDASATLVGGIGTAAAPVISVTNNNEVIVTLTGTLDNRRVTLNLTGVNGTGGGSPTIGFLVGDVDNTRAVNIVDISGVRARSGQATTVANFRWDVDVTGAINVVDISAVRSRSGLVLP